MTTKEDFKLHSTLSSLAPTLTFLSVPSTTALHPRWPLLASIAHAHHAHLRSLHLQALGPTWSLSYLLERLSSSPALADNLQHLRAHFTSHEDSIDLSYYNSSESRKAFPSSMRALQHLHLSNSSLLHAYLGAEGRGKAQPELRNLKSMESSNLEEEEACTPNSSLKDSNPSARSFLILEKVLSFVARQTPNLVALKLGRNFSFSEPYEGDMRSGARYSAVRPADDCPRCRGKLLRQVKEEEEEEDEDQSRDRKCWPSTDELCLANFRSAVSSGASAWAAGSLKWVAIQREDNRTLRSSLEPVFDQMDIGREAGHLP